MKKLFPLLLFVIVVGLLYLGYRSRADKYQEYEASTTGIHIVQDVTKESKFTLRKKRKQGYIWGYHITITGHVDGQADITLMQAGEPYQIKHLAGDVYSTWGGDWYFDSAEILYKPSSVKSGNLQVQYRFKDKHFLDFFMDAKTY